MSHDEIWHCRDGRRIPVGDMDVDHLRNALRMMIRSKRRADRRLQLVRMVFERREEDEARMLAMDKEFFNAETHERLADT